MFQNYKQKVIARRVEAGTRWLDGYFGREGWLNAINTQGLDLGLAQTCMIGQMFGGINQQMRDNFNTIVSKGILDNNQATARGFFLPKESPWPWVPTNEMYAELTTAWVEKIGELKAPASEGSVLSPFTAIARETVKIPKK